MQVLRRASARPATPRAAARRRDEFQELLDERLFAALADQTRSRMVACIARCRRACSVGEIAGCCGVDLSVVSRHLKALESAGVLAAERRGRTVRYQLRASDLASRLRALAEALERHAPDGSFCRNGGCCDGCC